MRTCFLVALALTWSCSHEVSPAPHEDTGVVVPPVATEAPSPGPGDLEPQDLEPVETRRSYGARDPDPLLKDVDCEFSMVCMPSFTRSYAVALVSQGTELPSAEPADCRWTIRFAADEPDRHRRLARSEDPRRSARAEVDPESARALSRAWQSVVRRTRYPRPHYEELPDGTRLESVRVGCDGTTYRFESGGYCGTTWEPKAELTWGITELGEELRKYALIDEKARPEQLVRCLELAKKLQASAEKRPW